MYDQFIEWVARPIYRFVVKPVFRVSEFIKKFFVCFGKFLWYLMVATTGNIIVLSAVLTIIKYRVEIVSHLPGPEEHSWMFGVLSVAMVGTLYICMAFLYNILHWMFSSYMRNDIICKEPQFIQDIVRKMYYGFRNIKEDVKKNDYEVQEIKRKRKEKREGEKAVKLAAKRLKKEKKIKKEEERKSKLDIIHDRADIIDL